MLRLTLGFTIDRHAGNTIEVVVGVFAWARNQQVFLFIHQVLAFEFSQLKVRRQLNRRGWASLFAHATENAAREVNAEELGVPAAILVLGLLQRDAAHRAGHGAEVAGDATLLAIRITGQHDAARFGWTGCF